MKLRIYPLKTECIFLELLLADIICFANIFGMTSLISSAFLLTFLILIVLIIKDIKGGRVKADLALLLILSVINVIFNGLFSSNTQWSFDYFKKLIMFLCAVSFFHMLSSNEIEENEQKIALWFGMVVALMFPVAFYILNIRTMLGRFLTMGFTNPNFTALWILHGFLYSVIAFFKSKRIWVKGVLAVIGISLLYIATLTVNRSIWVSIALFILLLLLGISKKYLGLNKTIITVLIILPIVIVALYHSLLSNSIFQRMFSFMISEGKGLASRTIMWDFAIEKLKHGWIIGDYSGISYGTGISQMHNTHLDILCSYGIVSFILFIGVMRRILISVSLEVESFTQHVALSAFLAVILFGIFEASLFSGCTGLNYLTGAFLILAKGIKEE
jgi:hypothetical protein